MSNVQDADQVRGEQAIYLLLNEARTLAIELNSAKIKDSVDFEPILNRISEVLIQVSTFVERAKTDYQQKEARRFL